MLKMKLLTSCIAAMTLGIAGCNGGGGSGSSTGTVSFDGTDAPVDGVSRVQVTFNRIDLKPKNGGTITIELDPAVTLDNLLDLTGDASEPILADTTVPAGEYAWLRLYVQGGMPDSEVDEDVAGRLDLFIPGQQPQSADNDSRYLHLNSGFIVPAGGDADFTIDFVLRKALTKPANQNYYLLRPALRLVNNVEVGSIEGTVDESLFSDGACDGNSVYLYSGHDADVGDVNVDIDGAPDHDSDNTDGNTPEVNPITTADVTQNQSGGYEYHIGFVAEGNYTVAFTCQSASDMPDTDEDLGFAPIANVVVEADMVTTYNFTAGG